MKSVEESYLNALFLVIHQNWWFLHHSVSGVFKWFVLMPYVNFL